MFVPHSLFELIERIDQMIRAIATDIDGTFLRSDRTYDQELFKKVYTAMQAQGIRFIIASGDQYDFLRSLFPDEADHLAYVAENGVLTIDHNMEIAFDHLSTENVSAITHFLDSLEGVAYCASGKKAAYVHHDASPEFKKLIPNFYTKIKEVADINQVTDDPIFKFAMSVPPVKMREIQATINYRFEGIIHATASGYGAVDLIIPGRDKSYGLHKLLDRWHLTPEQLVVFGNGENDLEMFNLAKTSYAMENAPENVKQAASKVIGTNEEQAVLHQIAKLVI